MKNLIYLACLLGLIVVRKAEACREEEYCEIPGDNIPVTLMDGLRARR